MTQGEHPTASRWLTPLRADLLLLACAAIWGMTLFLSRISSVSSLVSVIAAPVVAWALGYSQVVTPLLAIAAIVIIQHRANIGRLMRGEEPKVGSSGKAS